MTSPLIVSLQTLLEQTQTEPSQKNLTGNIRAIEDLFSSENRKTLDRFFQGAFVFLGFHPGVDTGVTSYIRSGSLSSDAGSNLLVLFTLDSRIPSPVALRNQSFEKWMIVDTAVHPSYTLIRSMFKDPVTLNFPGIIFLEDLLQNQNPVYVHILAPSDENAVRQQMRQLFALADKAYQLSVESQKNFLDLLALSLQKERIDYERGSDISAREWLINAFRFIRARSGDIVSIVNLFK